MRKEISQDFAFLHLIKETFNKNLDNIAYNFWWTEQNRVTRFGDLKPQH